MFGWIESAEEEEEEEEEVVVVVGDDSCMYGHCTRYPGSRHDASVWRQDVCLVGDIWDVVYSIQ